MLVSKQIWDYITKLVEPLVTMQRLDEMFRKLKKEIIERFEENFSAQNGVRKLLFKRKIYV